MSVFGQQLVTNGDFEAYNNCPVGLSNIAYAPGYNSFPTVKDWVRPTYGSSDYFNSCAYDPRTAVPANVQGYQAAHSGNAYAGSYVYNKSGGLDYREYLTTRLSKSLLKDSVYCVRFFVNPSDQPNKHISQMAAAVNKLGASFSDTIPNSPNNLPLQLPYHVLSDKSYYINDTAVWHEIQGLYTAKGGEKWLTIGCFGPDSPSYSRIDGASNGFPIAYYYIDDVSVTPATILDSVRHALLCDSIITLSSSASSGPYQWNTGATTRSIPVNSAGTYWCKGNRDCALLNERFIVSAAPTHDSVHGNVGICITSPSPLELSSSQPSGNYRWSTGSASRVLSVTQAGTYTCTTWHDCTVFHDVFSVTWDSVAPPAVYDTAICQHTIAPVLAMPYTGLIWYVDVSGDSGMTKQPVISTAKPGTLSLYVARRSGSCTSKKMPLTIDIKPTPDGHGAETVLECHDGTKRYKILGTEIDLPNMHYIWSTGDSLYSINPQSDGRYIRTATNECGSAVDTFYVRSRECDSCLAFPNAFSPNGDGINEGFRAMQHCEIKEYQLLVFNRWGEQVFVTDQLSGHWNGQYKGKPAPAGTYMYSASYHTLLSDKDYIIKGSVILFR